MDRPCIMLLRGTSLLSRLIQWQTRSPYSHAAIVTPSGTVIESVEGKGVREVPIEHAYKHAVYDLFDVSGLSDDQWSDALEWARSKIGSRYDYRGVLRFVSRRPAELNDKYFCSEFVFAAMLHAGLLLLERIPAHNVSPAILSYSPSLRLIQER